MKDIGIIILLALILFFEMVLGLAVVVKSGGQTYWEYKIETPHDANLLYEMNKAGNDGWELVESRRVLTGNEYIDEARTELVFKRRK